MQKELLEGQLNVNTFDYNIVQNPVPVHDLQSTLLLLMGLNHEK